MTALRGGKAIGRVKNDFSLRSRLGIVRSGGGSPMAPWLEARWEICYLNAKDLT